MGDFYEVGLVFRNIDLVGFGQLNILRLAMHAPLLLAAD
jgi:hypothetical protein